MADLSESQALFSQGRYFEVVLNLSDLTDGDFEQLAGSGDLLPLLDLATQCAEALGLPEFAVRMHLGAIRTLRRLGRSSAAASLVDQALERWPDDVGLQMDSALTCMEEKFFELAETHFRRAIALKPDDPVIRFSYANLLSAQQRNDEAEANGKEALRLDPAMPAAHNNLANLYKRLNRNTEAEYHYHSAIVVKPDFYEAHFNYGVFLYDQDRLEEAEAAYRRAIAADASQASAHNNLGTVLLSMGRPEEAAEAEQAYSRALALKPEYADRRVNLAILRLTQGRLKEAWPDYEARESPTRKERMTFPPPYSFERWQGQSLLGKSILVWREQGLGDQILFARYVVQLKSLGARQVVFVCSTPLKSLFAGLAGVDVLADDKDSIPACDYWTYLISLPLHFDTSLTTIPATTPYLSAQPALASALQATLSARPGINVGLCWRGSSSYSRDRYRSPGLARFQPLFALAGVNFYTLLPDSRNDFLAQAGGSAVDLGHEIDAATPPFVETAALMQQLDLIITSDTSIAHLAGALSKPTWLLLSNPAYWTWMLEREDSPWYPSMRLFRQPVSGAWDDVIERVKIALIDVIHSAASLPLATIQTPGATPTLSVPALLAPIAAGELLDKISILQIKAEHIQDQVKLKNIHNELLELERVAYQAKLAPAAQALLVPLRAVNQALWVIEDDIRECERRQDFGSEFIALARSVYITNDQRAALKRQINDLSGSLLIEEKSYAAY